MRTEKDTTAQTFYIAVLFQNYQAYSLFEPLLSGDI